MGKHIGEFVRNRVGVHRHRHGAERLGGHDRPIELWPVCAHNRDRAAALETQSTEAYRKRLYLVEHLRPGPGLPNSEILVAHRWPAAKAICVANQ